MWLLVEVWAIVSPWRLFVADARALQKEPSDALEALDPASRDSADRRLKQAREVHIMSIVTKWKSWAPQLLSVVRIVAAFMFILSGSTKILAFPAGMPNGATAPFMSQIWIGGMLELVGGSLLLLGLFTRPVAFVLAGEMAVAYFQFHAPKGFYPTVNGGVAAALYCFVWLYISAAGPGPWSLDAIRKK
jgi:putative oxidoreductase